MLLLKFDIYVRETLSKSRHAIVGLEERASQSIIDIQNRPNSVRERVGRAPEYCIVSSSVNGSGSELMS